VSGKLPATAGWEPALPRSRETRALTRNNRAREQRQRRIVFLACPGAERDSNPERIEPVAQNRVMLLRQNLGRRHQGRLRSRTRRRATLLRWRRPFSQSQRRLAANGSSADATLQIMLNLVKDPCCALVMANGSAAMNCSASKRECRCRIAAAPRKIQRGRLPVS